MVPITHGFRPTLDLLTLLIGYTSLVVWQLINALALFNSSLYEHC